MSWSAARALRSTVTPLLRGRTEDELADIRLEGVSRGFTIDGRHLPVLDSISFNVPDRQIVSVVGPNGSGKSTLLRLVAGLLPPEQGRVEIGGQPVVEADARVGLVFQEPRLLPWRPALENVTFPLELAGVPRAARHEAALGLLGLVGLEAFAGAYPHQLSGGMRQRVAIARALVREPSVLLLDEPFSALDALTRERFNLELLRLWERTATTIVLVTHSIPEAVFLSDRVVVLSPRPARVAADVAVDLPRPRSMNSLDGAAFSRAAAIIRALLLGDGADGVADEAAAERGRDVLENAGTAAWFDPWRSGS